MGCGVFRTLGHALEDIPPLIATREDRFVPLNEMKNPAKLLITLPAGYISEFVSALPPRLFIVQVFYIFQKLGYQPTNALTWAEASAIGERVGIDGWKAYPPVSKLIEPLVQAPKLPMGKPRSDMLTSSTATSRHLPESNPSGWFSVGFSRSLSEAKSTPGNSLMVRSSCTELRRVCFE